MADTLDPFVRHQVYIEGLKNGEAEQAETSLDEIAAAIILLATQLGIENLGDLTKRQMLSFVAQVRAKIKEVFNKHAAVTVEHIEAFLAANIELTGQVLEAVLGKPVPYGTVNLPYNTVANTPIAGTGIEPNALISATLAAITADLVAAIKSGYADSKPLAEFIRDIVGTKANNYRDGIIARLKRRWSTAVQTVIQHTGSLVSFKLQSLTADKYTWCSILDSRTSDICRERNGNVYEYRNGPRPPAHWNCRSFIVPVTITDLGDLPTFYTWVKNQPASVQDDVLGPSRGKGMRDGLVKSGDLPGFDRTRPLTVNQYQNKVDQILMGVA